MTDNKIIKALECCGIKRCCRGCYFDTHEVGDLCVKEIIKNALDLIARQQAEIERLQKDKSEWVHLPCKVGDTIYFDTYRRGENMGVQPHKVAKVEVVVSTERQFGSVGAEIPDWQFGKTVFLTREEAERALGERNDK